MPVKVVERSCDHCKKIVRAWFESDGKPREPYMEIDCPACGKPVSFDPSLIGGYIGSEIVPSDTEEGESEEKT